jgi:gliding motility-associated-like protein
LEGGGIIVLNGDTLPSSGVTLDLEADNVYSLTALPNDQWTVFSYWELNGNAITPDNLSATVFLELFENGSITAVFTTIPHHEVTVMVEPAESGLVIFEQEFISGNPYSTTNTKTVVLEGNKPLLFKAIPNQYIDFSKWQSANHAIQGAANAEAVRFTFQSADTIVAHFTPQPFAIYVPNSFSPNGDGINDVFKIEGNALDIEVFELTIFDRWGQIVFHSTDTNAVWTGEFNKGEYFVGNSSYSYRLKVKSIFDIEPRELSGSILMMR